MDKAVLAATTEILTRQVSRLNEDQELTEIVQARQPVLDHYQPLFSPDHLPQLAADEFRGFLNFENNCHWNGLHRQGSLVTKDMSLLRQALGRAAMAQLTVSERLDELVSVKNLGHGIGTAVLQIMFPDECGVWNATGEAAMKALGIWPSFADGMSDGKRYSLINEELKQIAQAMGETLWTLDALWYALLRRDPHVWWVNQSQTLKADREAEIIWAPVQTAGGKKPDAWDLTRLREHDVILHCANGAIRAVGRVKAEAVNAIRPANPGNSEGETDGHLVGVEYHDIVTPITTTEIPERLRRDINGPFDKNGALKQLFLAEVPSILTLELQRLFADRWPSVPGWSEHNAWLFQADPDVWNLEQALENAQPGDLEEWKLSRYKTEVGIGDPIILWQSGPMAGIYAIGEVVSETRPRTLKPDEGDAGAAEDLGVDVRYRTILPEPILRTALVNHPVLSNMAVLRSPQGTNHRVTSEEWQAIQSLLSPAGPSPEAEPFASLFTTVDEANWAFDLMQEAALRLGLSGPEDERMTVSLRYRDRAIHFTVGTWLMLGFYSPGYRQYRVCLPGWSKESAFPEAARDATFAVRTGERPVSLYVLTQDQSRSLGDAQRGEYLAVLDQCADRFQTLLRSPYRRAHVPEIGRAIFDADYRQELFDYGLAGKPRTPYTVEQCAEETGFSAEEIKRWISGIERKKQAIIYGPPGTGKTFVAERLAKVLANGGAGVTDLVQFHPAYAYEDFIQGIRPVVGEEGVLSYDLVPGVFLDYCARAAQTKDVSVLVIDEVNRANLSRVFGELMYLLEYRDKEIPLASGGTLRIPDNVRVIGTMNTADRSIALVDHALRRRFAFLSLYPNWTILTKYHENHKTSFPVSRLVEVLTDLNAEIGDPHYAVGISFFMRPDLVGTVEDIWSMEIEPYLEEYFFNQTSSVERFRWDKVRQSLGLS